MTAKLLKMKDINKSFGPVKVLQGVDLDVEKGEIHALLGENGAGKSTLMNILGGIHLQNSGTIEFNDTLLENITPDISKTLGIGFVHQELNLAEALSVAENIFMGRLPEKKGGIIDYALMYKESDAILKSLGAAFKSQALVSSLTTANKQLVEIAKAISLDAQIIIFDEPTTSLSNKDVERLFVIIKRLKNEGVSSIYISHRMEEIFTLCDRATVLRDGVSIGTVEIKNTNTDQIIKMMVGRELVDLFPKNEVAIGDRTLHVDNLSDENGKVKNVSFSAHSGEVVGFAGLVGAGRTETMRLLFGADKLKTGTIEILNQAKKITSPVDAINAGVCLLTEDRKNQGLALKMSIKDNMNLTKMDTVVINEKEMTAVSDKYVNALRIKVSNVKNNVDSLSGGNQQKVVLAKWLNKDAPIFVFDEPTKGIDVGAKAEIYEIINDLVAEGKTIIVVSSEINELLGIADRIYVMREGEITGELSREEADSEAIMKLATIGGGK